MMAQVFVGFDGSSSSEQALAWATFEANARGAELRVVETTTGENSLPDVAASAERNDLLVVATNEAGAGRTALWDSVTRSASRTSPCPVVVVRGNWRGQTRRIVVATDSSSASLAGLVVAADEAALHVAELLVVYVRDHRVDPLEAQCIVDLSVNECLDHRVCRVSGMVVDGDPTTALVAASADADLLVMGSRGRSGFKTMLFGSVAEALVDGAQCPVLVTHPRPRCV